MQEQGRGALAYGEQDRVFDELLVISVRAGDRRAAERLAAHWHPRLLRTATRILGQAEQGQDAAQEAWLAISASWIRLEDPRRFPAWAYAILHRKCTDIQRRLIRDRKRHDQAAELSGTGQNPAQAGHTAINAAFQALAPDHRTVAALYFAEGLTLIEISRALGIPVGTVKSRLFNARKQLKSRLERTIP